MTDQPDNGKGFEASLERLETIVTEMEEGRLSLEEMIKRFEEGQTLLKSCTRTLNEIERKVEKLVKKGDDVKAVPLDAEDEEPEAGGIPPREAELF